MVKKLLQSFTGIGSKRHLRSLLDTQGVLTVESLIPGEDIDRYVNEFWNKNFSFDEKHRRSTNSDQMYLSHPHVLDLLLHENINSLFSNLDLCLALHADLTHWRSSNTGWHVDLVDNNPNAADQYVGVWIALDDIDPNTGPFQYIPYSHRWNLEENKFPRRDGVYMNHMCQLAMESHEHSVETFLPKKGDVMVWNSRVIHRGSPPRIDKPRPALIGHFSNQWTWSDSPERPSARKVEKTMKIDDSMENYNGGWYKKAVSVNPPQEQYDKGY